MVDSGPNKSVLTVGTNEGILRSLTDTDGSVFHTFFGWDEVGGFMNAIGNIKTSISGAPLEPSPFSQDIGGVETGFLCRIFP